MITIQSLVYLILTHMQKPLSPKHPGNYWLTNQMWKKSNKTIPDSANEKIA